ncbi:unnamed protein product, partial [Prorocentrum cordatum]
GGRARKSGHVPPARDWQAFILIVSLLSRPRLGAAQGAAMPPPASSLTGAYEQQKVESPPSRCPSPRAAGTATAAGFGGIAPRPLFLRLNYGAAMRFLSASPSLSLSPFLFFC